MFSRLHSAVPERAKEGPLLPSFTCSGSYLIQSEYNWLCLRVFCSAAHIRDEACFAKLTRDHPKNRQRG